MTIHEDDNKEDHENIVQARKRSYLVGSVGPTSLLGTQELERQLPNRTIRIFVGTWNMNGQVNTVHAIDYFPSPTYVIHLSF